MTSVQTPGSAATGLEPESARAARRDQPAVTAACLQGPINQQICLLKLFLKFYWTDTAKV